MTKINHVTMANIMCYYYVSYMNSCINFDTCGLVTDNVVIFVVFLTLTLCCHRMALREH